MENVIKLEGILGWGMNSRRTSAWDVQTLSIANDNLVSSLIAWVHRQVIWIISNVISGAWIYIPALVSKRIERGGHGSKLCRGMPALEGVIHTMIAIENHMSSSVANLATRFWITELIIGVVLCVTSTSTIVSPTFNSASIAATWAKART